MQSDEALCCASSTCEECLYQQRAASFLIEELVRARWFISGYCVSVKQFSSKCNKVGQPTALTAGTIIVGIA